jgi:glycolate oxidase FAD binding subunit
MAVSTAALSGVLGDIVGDDHLLSSASALDLHAVDGHRPRWVARPADAQEVSRLLMVAHAEDLAVSPRGSGSSLGLGNPPTRLDLVIDLSRLSHIEDYTPADMTASVGAGARLGALAAPFAAEGQLLALDPFGGEGRSIGGVLATAASGPRRFRYGTGRDLLLGVRIAQADGTLTWGGARVVKSVTGYDVPKLMVGALGTLGVIVSATLRLHPRPAATGSWLLPFASHAAAEGFLAALLDSSIEPERLALLDSSARARAGLGPGGWAALISVASVAEAVASEGTAVARLAARHNADAAVMDQSVWRALGRALDGPVEVRIGCEIRQVAHWMRELEALGVRARVQASGIAEAGNGVIHAALTGSDADVAGVVGRLRDGLAPEGGSVVMHRAPATLKRMLDAWGPPPAGFALMERIKRELDPQGILNPGRFLGGL